MMIIGVDYHPSFLQIAFLMEEGVTLNHTYSPHFSSSLAYFCFFTGDFLQQAPPGKNVGYLYAILTFLF